ncbi:MAG: hypothetical protein ABIS03_11305 [Gemmatimonadaceae bacterium]
MRWIKMAVAGLALCASASVATAQGGPPPDGMRQGGPPGGGMRGGRGMQMLFGGITLTDAQQNLVEAINTRYREQMQGMRGGGMGGGAPDPSMREKMMASRAAQEKEVRAILTSDQQKLFDKNVAKAKKRREEGGRQGAGRQG